MKDPNEISVESRRRGSGTSDTPAYSSTEDDIEYIPMPERPRPTHGRNHDSITDDDERLRGGGTTSRQGEPTMFQMPPPIESPGSEKPSRRVAVPVPASERRGFLPWLSITPEVDRPHDYTDGNKWRITFVVALAACAAPMGSAIFYPSLSQISDDLHTSKTVINLSVAVYLISLSIFPLWWSSFSETLGRRNIYLVSFALNVIFTTASGLSTDIAQLIVFRTLSGGASASVQAVGAGTIADIWESRQRGRAMGIFYLGPLCGPLLAPIIGGALTGPFGWRSTMWFLAVYGALILVMVLFGVPETLARSRQEQAITAAVADVIPPNAETLEAAPGGGATPQAPLSRVSTRRSIVQTRTRVAGIWLKRALIDPLSILKLMKFPAVALIVSYGSITFGSLYVLNICIQSAFEAPPYSYPPLIVGLLYIPSSLGYFIASLLGGPWIDRIMEREAKRAGRYDDKGELIRYPEDRMKENAWISATLFPGALIWFGWSVQFKLYWAVPAVAQFFFGVGSMLVFSMATTMLTEFMPRRASSGVALNNFVRNILSATGSVITQPLIGVLGFGWLATAVALLAWIGGNVCLVLVSRNSQKWRARMNEQMK